MNTDERQAVIDEEHLRLLALFHYISGGVTLAFSLFFGVWIGFVATMVSSFPPMAKHGGPPMPDAVFPVAMFIVFGVFFVTGVAYGVLEILAGRYIARRRRRVLTLLLALPRILFLPYGVVLSLLTLLVLERSSVKQLYRSG